MFRRQRMNRRCNNTAAAAVLLTIMLLISGCSLLPMEEQSLAPPLIQPTQEELDIIEVSRGSIQTFLRGNANFVSSNVEVLAFKESGGRMKGIYAVVGQEVKAGELVAELETGDLEHLVSMHQLNVERAQLLLQQARENNAGKIDLRLREIDLEREQKTLKLMQERLSKSQLYAQSSGVVTFVENMKAGDYVNAFQSIVTIADTKSIQLTYVSADAKELNMLEVGMPASIRYKGVEYEGKVLQTPSSVPIGADPAKTERNAATIILGIDNPPDDVQVGHSAEILIQLQKREEILLLPRSAIRSYMGRNYVQVAEGERRKEVDVEVGLTTPTEVEIVKGLEEGQQVILNN